MAKLGFAYHEVACCKSAFWQLRFARHEMETLMRRIDFVTLKLFVAIAD